MFAISGDVRLCLPLMIGVDLLLVFLWLLVTVLARNTSYYHHHCFWVLETLGGDGVVVVGVTAGISQKFGAWMLIYNEIKIGTWL